MTNSLKYFFDKIQDSYFLRTKKGLFFVIFILYFLFSYQIKPFKNSFSNDILSLALVLLYILFWFYFSGRLFFSSKIKILFAIDYSLEAQSYSRQIEKTINSKIDELTLTRSIKIIHMPSDFIVTDRIKAERYVKTHLIDLLIWGYTLDGKLQNSKVSEFKLKFTYLYKILPEESKEMFVRQITSSLRSRYWKILDERSFEDVEVVSSNITEVSLFILGLCLYVRGDLKNSLHIFEKLKAALINKTDLDFPGVSNIKTQVDSYLIDGYHFIGVQLREKKPRESRDYFDKILKIDPNDSGAHLNLAKLYYLLDNNLAAAKMHTAKVTDPYIKPLANYNYAFFAILEKDPKKILSHYQQLRTVPSENIVDIIIFLQNEFSKNLDNILFHFALGYLNIYHADTKIGVQELRKFVKKARGITEYDELVSNAEALLKNREKRLMR